jgi:hypothetical protein
MNTPKPDTSESPLIDAEDFEIAFKPYAAYPDAALDLARRFIAIKEFLQSQPPDIPQAMAALDEAVDVLFPLTRFHKAGYDLYRTYIEGRATRAHEHLMETLGIRF